MGQRDDQVPLLCQLFLAVSVEPGGLKSLWSSWSLVWRSYSHISHEFRDGFGR